MFGRSITLSLIALLWLALPLRQSHAQEKKAGPAPPAPSSSPTPAPREEQEPVQVFTEEVRLPVLVTDERGRFDPTLEMEDVVVLEDDVPQEIRSLRRLPANVLLLLDTGSQFALAKDTQLTRDVSLRLVNTLGPESRICVLQFNDRVELLQDWTSDRNLLAHALRTRLYAGKRARLTEAVAEAAKRLRGLPAGTRHVVIVTDGVEPPGGEMDYAEAVRKLMAEQATVHVISYTALTRELVRQRYPDSPFMTPPKNNPPRPADPAGDPGMPPGQTRNPSYTLFGLDLDFKHRREARDYARSTEQSERRLRILAEDTGGRIMLPASNGEMVRQGEEVAHEIDAQYVITYRPRRPLAEAAPGEYRRISVALRRAGLTVHARRGYTVAR